MFITPAACHNDMLYVPADVIVYVLLVSSTSNSVIVYEPIFAARVLVTRMLVICRPLLLFALVSIGTVISAYRFSAADTLVLLNVSLYVISLS